MNKDALKLSVTLAVFVGFLCLIYNIPNFPLGATIGYCFVGFACTVALGMDPKKLPHYFISALSGWAWGYLFFWLLTLATVPLLGDMGGNLIGGMIFGIVAFYLYLGVFQNTVLRYAPLMVCSVSTCFLTGFYGAEVQAMISVLFGVICAGLVMPANSLWRSKNKKAEEAAPEE